MNKNKTIAIIILFLLGMLCMPFCMAQTLKPTPKADTILFRKGIVFRANVIANDKPASGKMMVTGFYVKTTTKNTPGKTVNIPGCGSVRIDSSGEFIFTPFNDTFKGPLPSISYVLNNGLPGNGTSAKVAATIFDPVLVDESLYIGRSNGRVFYVIEGRITMGDIKEWADCQGTHHFIVWDDPKEPLWKIPENVYQLLK